MSAWVIVWLAVQVIDVAGGQRRTVGRVQTRSLTVRVGHRHVASVVLPLLVAVIV